MCNTQKSERQERRKKRMEERWLGDRLINAACGGDGDGGGVGGWGEGLLVQEDES